MAATLAAVELVAHSHDASLVLRSSAGRRRSVQISRVPGEDAVLCEAVGSDYLGWRRELSERATARLNELGWQNASDAFTLWADAETPRQQQRLAGLLLETLVDLLDHDPARPPGIAPP